MVSFQVHPAVPTCLVKSMLEIVTRENQVQISQFKPLLEDIVLQ